MLTSGHPKLKNAHPHMWVTKTRKFMNEDQKTPITCYMCDKPKTSGEHAPPKGVFPAQKDLPNGVDLRRNLITVPSCDEHNSQKSKDDEYFRNIIVSHRYNNPVAENHFFNAVVRSMQRNPDLLSWFQNEIRIEGGVAFNVDYPRLERCAEQMVRALYFHQFGHKYVGEIEVLFPDLRDENPSPYALRYIQYTEVIRDRIEKDPKYKWHGENPKVFKYKAEIDNSSKEFVMSLKFYEGFSVVAASLAEENSD